jgi:hypothetical protein
MGFRSFFRRFVSKVKEVLGIYDKYNDFKADAYFSDGGVATFRGKPWGSAFEHFKYFVAEDAYAIEMNVRAFWFLKRHFAPETC